MSDIGHRGRPARGGRGAPGFTFVEVLVTAIVLALLAALMIPAVLGARDRATDATAQSLLRAGASAVETAAVASQGYATLTTADLRAIEPNIAWQPAADARADQDQVTLTGVGPAGYTLTTTSPAGTVYTLSRDTAARPTVTRTCGPGCSW